MHLIATQTTIPVPPVRRVIVSKDREQGYLDMEYIEGVDLDELWPTASWWTRLKIIWTLRGYIRQLRKIRPPYPDIPGPITLGGRANPCYSWLEFGSDGSGPFSTYKSLRTTSTPCGRSPFTAHLRLTVLLSESKIVLTCRVRLSSHTVIYTCEISEWGKMENYGCWIGDTPACTLSGTNLGDFQFERRGLLLDLSHGSIGSSLAGILSRCSI